VSFGCVLLIAQHAVQLRLIDVPNLRSSHQTPIPRGGGLGVVAGVASGVLVLAALGMGPSRQLAILLFGTAGIAALGAIEDRHALGARYRLSIQILIATGTVISVGPVERLPLPPPLDLSLGWLSVPLTVLWVVSVTNFYNFMDGIDGLAGGQAVASCIGVVVASWSMGATQLAILLASAAVGFLALNWPPARIFLGDSGSTLLGFTISSLPLLAPVGHRPAAVLAVAIGLSLFLLDPVETLQRLVRSGKRIGEPHRSHSYQILASTPERHRGVATAMTVAGLVLGLSGALAYRVEGAAWPVILLGITAFAGERFLANRVSTRGVG
jgi:glycosyltransferase WbpL